MKKYTNLLLKINPIMYQMKLMDLSMPFSKMRILETKLVNSRKENQHFIKKLRSNST